MKTQLTILACLIAGSVHATTLDLGPNGITHYRTYNYSALNGTKFNGQTISVDLTFSTQIHLFDNTYPDLLIGLSFLTSGGESFITGTGYVMDINGNAMIGTDSRLGSANTTDLMFVGLFPNYYGLGRPSDIYGAHFEITLPTMDGNIVAGGIELFDNQFPQAKGFRIGPHIPEGGCIFLNALAVLLGMILFNCFVIKTK